MAQFDLMSVREMIDSAFGETDSSCPVNLNMAGTVLFILARRMQLLKRHFKVQMSDVIANRKISKSTFTITEIKIHTKKKSLDKKGGFVDELLPSDKRLTGKLKRSTRKRSRKTSLHKTPSGKRFSDDSSSGISSDGEVSRKKSTAHRRSSKKYTPGKMSHAERGKDEDYSEDLSPDARRKTRKHYDEKLAVKQRKSGRYSDEMSPSERRRTGKFSDKTSPTERRKAGEYSDEMSTSKRRKTEKYSDEKSLTERRKARKYSDEMSTSERRKTEKYSDEKSSTERRKPGKYSDEMSTTERRRTGKYSAEISVSERSKFGKYSDDISPDERKKYSEKMSPAERHRGGKYSNQMSSSERSESGKYYSPTEFSSESAISGKYRSDKHSGPRGKADAELYSQRETTGRFKETDSNESKRRYGARQVDDDDDDLEEQHEKIYIVTRTPSGRQIREPALKPVVTQEQFKGLLARTRELQNKFGISKSTAIKWSDLKSSNCITHPKAALNMSVRLDAAETSLARMLEVVEQIARQVPGIDLQTFFDEESIHLDTHKIFEVAGPTPLSETLTVMTGDTGDDFQTSDSDSEPGTTKPKDIVTHGQFNAELKRMRDGVVYDIRHAMDQAGFHKCDQTMSKTELIVNQMHNKFKDIMKLDFAIEEFGEKVVATDERITLEMTTFQDNLMLMQSELEIALEKMNEAFLAPKEDAAAVALITGNFINYSSDLARTERIQTELKGELEAYQQSLKNVEERKKIIRNRKCTRDEMFEALNDKLTLKDINGLLTSGQFDAVIANMKRILQNLYLAIFTKECDWQRAIDENKSKYNECGDSIQIETLKSSMRKYLTKMDKDVDEMFSIAGPLRKPPTNKKIERDGHCLCCGASAESKKTKLGVKLWQELLSSTQSVKFRNEEIAKLCIPGKPIPHPLDLNSFVCEHDCGDIVKPTEVFKLYIKELNSTRTNDDHSVATSGKKKKEDHEIA